jgi:class 3 adenylate cyclase
MGKRRAAPGPVLCGVASGADAGRLYRQHDHGDAPEDAPRDDPQFLRWCAKFARFAATPGSYAAFDRMWYATDVGDMLHAVHAPTLVLFKAGASGWGDREHGAYLAERIPVAQLVSVPGTAGVVWIEEPEPLVVAIESFLASVRQEEAVLDRVLATVLFTDIVGSTSRSAELGDKRWNELLQRHHRVVRALLARYRGNEISTAGDGFLATFDGPARAVRCAQAIAEAVTPLDLEIRAGLHTGEIELINQDVGGIAVSIGARVGSMAGPSEVLVSQTVMDLIAGSGIGFHDRGVHTLKGVPGEWHLYAVEPGPAPLPL